MQNTACGERKEGVARLEFTTGNTVSLFCGAIMINNSTTQKWNRLAQKTRDTQFLQEMIRGLNASPYEAAAILDSVYKIYGSTAWTDGTLQPGQFLFQVLAIDNPPSVALSRSKQISVTLTLDQPNEDLPIRQQHGVVELRRHRLQRMAHEAFQQGGVLTVEDLANRIFNCGERTLCRDLTALRKKNISVPLRSTINDMGRTISHRSLIVQEWLQGKEYSDIARSTFHSVASIQNYIEKFKRVVVLSNENYDVYTIAFLVKLSVPLVKEYHRLSQQLPIVSHRKKDLETFTKKNLLPPPAPMERVR